MPEPGRKIHHIGLSHAWDGLRYALVRHPNFRIHTVVSIAVLGLGWYLNISLEKFVLLIFAVVIGFSLEMVNTAIETVVDLVTQEWRQSAKVAKDVAAGAMLVVAIGTAVVGVLILGPEILNLVLL